MAKPAIPLPFTLQQIPQPVPVRESEIPMNAIFGFVPGNQNDARKGNIGYADLAPPKRDPILFNNFRRGRR